MAKIPDGMDDKKDFIKEVEVEQNIEIDRLCGELISGEHSPVAEPA